MWMAALIVRFCQKYQNSFIADCRLFLGKSEFEALLRSVVKLERDFVFCVVVCDSYMTWSCKIQL